MATRHLIARLRHQLDNPAGVGRKHRRGAILIDGDLALGDMLGPEIMRGHRLDGQARPFGRCRDVAVRSLAGLTGHVGRAWRRHPAEMRKPKPCRAGESQHDRADAQIFSAKYLRSLVKFWEHRIRSSRHSFWQKLPHRYANSAHLMFQTD
jgi:hypothetical protein